MEIAPPCPYANNFSPFEFNSSSSVKGREIDQDKVKEKAAISFPFYSIARTKLYLEKQGNDLGTISKVVDFLDPTSLLLQRMDELIIFVASGETFFEAALAKAYPNKAFIVSDIYSAPYCSSAEQFERGMLPTQKMARASENNNIVTIRADVNDMFEYFPNDSFDRIVVIGSGSKINRPIINLLKLKVLSAKLKSNGELLLRPYKDNGLDLSSLDIVPDGKILGFGTQQYSEPLGGQLYKWTNSEYNWASDFDSPQYHSNYLEALKRARPVSLDIINFEDTLLNSRDSSFSSSPVGEEVEPNRETDKMLEYYYKYFGAKEISMEIAPPCPYANNFSPFEFNSSSPVKGRVELLFAGSSPVRILNKLKDMAIRGMGLFMESKAVFSSDNKSSSYGIFVSLKGFFKDFKHFFFREKVSAQNDNSKRRSGRVMQDITEIQVAGNQCSLFFASEAKDFFVFKRVIGYISDIYNIITGFFKPAEKGTRDISINDKFHNSYEIERGISSSLARSAANNKQALMSWSVRGGYSDLISSEANPEDNASKTTYTGVRVPLTQGSPRWIFWSTVILSNNLLGNIFTSLFKHLNNTIFFAESQEDGWLGNVKHFV
jgi:hypothetical protein